MKIRSIILLGFGVLLSLPGDGQTPGRTPVLTTPYFSIYSDFDTNLNDALISAGLARKNGKPGLFHAGQEVSCFETLAPSARAGWEGAVDYYSKIVSPFEWSDRPQFLLRLQLVGFDTAGQSAQDREFIETARTFRVAAAPAYSTCRWKAQDESNRLWIEEMRPRLAADGRKAAARIAQLYRKTWRTLPMVVDVVETVNWSGANTSWSDLGQGDILISSLPRGASAFEILFHESSHVLMDRGDPVRAALEDAAKAAQYRLPNDLWHVVLFYTTGEAIRRILDDRGPGGYTPMLYEIFARGSSSQYREALEREWRPYVEGKRTLPEAAADLIGALKAAERR
jgi:hypothetical protein